MTKILNPLIFALLILIALFALWMNAQRYLSAREIVTAINTDERTIERLYDAGKRYNQGTPEIAVVMIEQLSRKPQLRTTENLLRTAEIAHTAEKIEPDSWQVAGVLSSIYRSQGRTAASNFYRDRVLELAPKRFKQ